MLNRPLSQAVTGLSGRRLMAAGRGYQYRGDGGKLGWLGAKSATVRQRPAEAQLNTPVDCGAWQTWHAWGGGGWGGLGPKTRLLWQLITRLKSRTRPMDHLPPASTQPKDSGSSSSFTQEGVQQLDSVRWCVEARVRNVRLIYRLRAQNCQYTIIYYIYPFPILCYHNDPISPWGSLNFHLISSANAPLSRRSPPRHPPPTLRFIMSSDSSSSFMLPAAASVARQFRSQLMTARMFNLNLAGQHAMPRGP